MKHKTIVVTIPAVAAWLVAGVGVTIILQHLISERDREIERAFAIQRERWERGRADGPASRRVEGMGFDS
jgi:hypothetical protein